jgi:hypothetical protein
MYFPLDLEKKLPPKDDKGVGGLVIFPRTIDFGVIRNEGIYCVPFVIMMRPGDNYSEYLELIRYKHGYIYISDV